MPFLNKIAGHSPIRTVFLHHAIWKIALMPIIDQKIVIQKPLFDVFRMAMDFNNLSNWQPRTTAVNITSGDPIRPGTMITIRRGSVFINADVVEYDRNKKITLQGIWGRFRFNRTIEFQSGGRETTILDKLNIQTGWLYFWYAPILAMNLRGELSAEWAQLKKQLESSSYIPGN